MSISHPPDKVQIGAVAYETKKAPSLTTSIKGIKEISYNFLSKLTQELCDLSWSMPGQVGVPFA